MQAGLRVQLPIEAGKRVGTRLPGRPMTGCTHQKAVNESPNTSTYLSISYKFAG